MISYYQLDTKDEKILKELDNLCGVTQNKEILRDIILYLKLRQNNELDFGNYNIIIRNNSYYNLLNDLLKVCAKVFYKYHVIENKKICYLDRIKNNRKECPWDKISEIKESIIVINKNKLRIDYQDELDNLKKIIKRYKNKVFIFEDTIFCEGETDAEIGELASFRMVIDKVSLEDKIHYCENKFDEQKLKYEKEQLKEYADIQFWTLKNMITKLIIECKSKKIDNITQKMLMKNKEFYVQRSAKSKSKEKIEKQKSNGTEELQDLIGLDDVKRQTNKILNYIKLNKEKGKIPSLHMCFTGNPGTGKTSIARIIGKIFEEEEILSGNGEFVEIHGRDLIDKYVGWTAQKVKNTVKKAIGGVLFIDEAYSLVSDRKGSFEDEAIATLIKEMEDHRNEICIILAGYTEEMNDLMKTNPGLESRIQFTINFPDYSADELLKIFESLYKKEEYKLSSYCKEILIDNFNMAKNKENFGNGRYVRNLFEKVKIENADRIVNSNSASINTITKNDIENTIKTISFPKTEVRKIGFC